MKILITGATGFLGSALAPPLLQRGHQVSLLARHTSSFGRFRGELDQYRIGRCGSDSEVREFIASVRPDAVMHTACTYGRAGECALQMADVNTRYAMLVLDAAMAACTGPLSFINTGTALEPDVSDYALSKHHFSQWGNVLAQRSAGGLRFINVRLQHMYGPGDDRSKFVTHVIRSCRENVPQLALTAGEQNRDFIYIDDVLDAYAALLRHADDFGAYEDIDVGSGQAPSIRSLVETVHRLTRSSTRLDFGAIPYRPNEAMVCMADIRRIASLGWRPRFDLDTGLARTIQEEFSQ